MVADRHADAGVGIHHLLGRDHLDLVGVDIQLVLRGDARDLAFEMLEQFEGPIRPAGRLGVFQPAIDALAHSVIKTAIKTMTHEASWPGATAGHVA